MVSLVLKLKNLEKKTDSLWQKDFIQKELLKK